VPENDQGEDGACRQYAKEQDASPQRTDSLAVSFGNRADTSHKLAA
jgi:hypothetical protein